MFFNVSVHHGRYLLAVATGRAMVCDGLGMLDLVSRVTQLQGNRHAVLDLLAVDVDFTHEEHIALGQHAAQVLGHLERVAIVVNQDFRVGTGEEVARAAGLALQTFTDIVSATDWIVEEG